MGLNRSISIFFPCYNDEKSIAKLVDDSYKILRKLSPDYEVIVVDDGSTDSSVKVLSRLSEKYPQLNVVIHQKNQGYGRALKTGFGTASKDLIFYTDGDGQYDVRELPLLFSLMTDDVNFVNGIKMSRHDPSYRIVLGNFYSFIARWLFWLPIYDVDCDFRLIRRELIRKIDLSSSSGSICIELVKKSQRNGAKFRQVSIHHYPRKWGSSQFFQFNRLAVTFWDILILWIKLMIFDKLHGNSRV